MERYEPSEIEAKWQRVWDAEQAFSVSTPEDPASEPRERKFYMLEMLPYPSTWATSSTTRSGT